MRGKGYEAEIKNDSARESDVKEKRARDKKIWEQFQYKHCFWPNFQIKLVCTVYTISFPLISFFFSDYMGLIFGCFNREKKSLITRELFNQMFRYLKNFSQM